MAATKLCEKKLVEIYPEAVGIIAVDELDGYFMLGRWGRR